MTRPRLVELMVGEKLARESAEAAVAAPGRAAPATCGCAPAA